MTIERVDAEVVRFSRRLQPSGAWPQHQRVRCTAIGSLDDQLLLRSGGAIYRLPVQQVVRGVPGVHRPTVARSLAMRNAVVWCRLSRSGNRVLTTLPTPARSGVHLNEFDALPLAVVEANDLPVGVLLRAVHDQGHLWMPVGEATWMDAPTSTEIHRFLVAQDAPVRVYRMSDGRVSITRVRVVRRQRMRLLLGSILRVEPCDVPKIDLSGRSTVVARISTTPLLVRLGAAPEECSIGEPLQTEVAELGTAQYPAAVRTVRHGHRLHQIDLPRRLATGTPHHAAQEQDHLASTHAQWWNSGLADDSSVGEVADSTTEDLLRAASSALSGRQDDPRVQQALDRWLTAYGQTAFNLRPSQEIELAPMLAACLLLAQRGESNTSADARGAVLLAHQAGLRAARSLHVELIIRHWLPLGRGGMPARALPVHARLATLRFPQEMNRVDLRAAMSFGSGVLARVGDGSLDDGSAPIAGAVLATLGRLTPGFDLTKGAELLGPLSGLGRALHPPQGEAVAQNQLLPEQLAHLTFLLRRTVDLPIVLLPLPPNSGPDEHAQQLARSVLNRKE